jgi:hypothetical protein
MMVHYVFLQVLVLVMVSGVPGSVLVILTRMQVDDLVADSAADIGYSSACFDGVTAKIAAAAAAAIDSATQSSLPL